MPLVPCTSGTYENYEISGRKTPLESIPELRQEPIPRMWDFQRRLTYEADYSHMRRRSYRCSGRRWQFHRDALQRCCKHFPRCSRWWTSRPNLQSFHFQLRPHSLIEILRIHAVIRALPVARKCHPGGYLFGYAACGKRAILDILPRMATEPLHELVSRTHDSGKS